MKQQPTMWAAINGCLHYWTLKVPVAPSKKEPLWLSACSLTRSGKRLGSGASMTRCQKCDERTPK